MTIPEGNVDIETDKPEFDEITITIKSGPLNTDGQVKGKKKQTPVRLTRCTGALSSVGNRHSHMERRLDAR